MTNERYLLPSNEADYVLSERWNQTHLIVHSISPRRWELQMQKFHPVRTQSLNVLPLQPGVGQYIAYILRLLPGISSLLISTFPGHSPAFFFQNLSRFFPVLAVANAGSCVGPQNKISHPAGCGFPCWVPAEYKYFNKKFDLWYDDLWNDWLGDRTKFVFIPDAILCGWLGSKNQLTN